MGTVQYPVILGAHGERRTVTNQDTPEDVEPVTQADLDSFAGRLDEWGASLPPTEQAILKLLLAKPQGDADTQGYYGALAGGSFSSLATTQFSPLLAQGIGVGGLGAKTGADWMNFGWQKSGFERISGRGL